MDWILIITLALTSTLNANKYATIETIDFSSEDSCIAAKEVYLAENKNNEGMIISAVCVSRGIIIKKYR